MIFNYSKVLILSVESNIFIPMQSTNQGSIISVRTAGGRMQSIAPSGEYGADFVPQKQVHYSATSATLGCPSPYSIKGTTSFTAISSEVGEGVATQDNLFGGPAQMKGRAYAGRPDRPPVGQEMPLGGMLLPMLVMVCAYMLVKVINRKKSQAL